MYKEERDVLEIRRVDEFDMDIFSALDGSNEKVLGGEIGWG